MGKKLARQVILLSFIPSSIISVPIVFLAVSDWALALRVGAASGFTYILAASLDVFVFQWSRDKWAAWWTAPTVSTLITVAFAQYVFLGSAFAGSSNSYMSAHWLTVATNQILIKMVVSSIMVLPAYGILLNWLERKTSLYHRIQ